MHVPDGFLDAPTSLATAAVAAGALGLALRRTGTPQGAPRAPGAETPADTPAAHGPALPGLTAAFVFAAQMINFPVGAGTSGHLMGAALAAALVGPGRAILVMTTVVGVQALLFADGGLTALGTNLTLMGLVATVSGYGVARAALAVLPRRPRSAAPAAAVGAFVSVPAAALAFTALYAVGGTVPVPLPALATAMLGWHVLIGLGEAAITAAVLGAVVATRPDLVHLARLRAPVPTLVDAAGNPVGPPSLAPEAAAPAPARGLLATGLCAALVVAGVLSLVASAAPDGLARVAAGLGLDAAEVPSPLDSGPLAGYAVAGLDGALATGLAGFAGVLVVAAVTVQVARAARGRPARPNPADRPAPEPAPATAES